MMKIIRLPHTTGKSIQHGRQRRRQKIGKQTSCRSRSRWTPTSMNRIICLTGCCFYLTRSCSSPLYSCDIASLLWPPWSMLICRSGYFCCCVILIFKIPEAPDVSYIKMSQSHVHFVCNPCIATTYKVSWRSLFLFSAQVNLIVWFVIVSFGQQQFNLKVGTWKCIFIGKSISL